MSRRERLREGTRDEIKTHARQQMAQNGTATLSLNAIARAMELVPSALYRYYASREDLITALISDGYDALADAMAAADAEYAPHDHAGRLFAVSLAYRAWALDNPTDFQLLFGTPIPGYRAPLEETLVPAERVFSLFLQPMQAAYELGQLRLPGPREQLVAMIGAGGYPKPGTLTQLIAPEVGYVGQACWAKLHGMVMLELTQHLSIDDHDGFVRYELQSLLQQIGMLAADTS